MASGLKFIPFFLNVSGIIVILNTAEKVATMISGIICVCYYCNAGLYTVAYLQWHVANTEVGTQQANGADCRPQYTPTCLESSDCSRSFRWMQKNNFEAFSCTRFNFKNSAPECTTTLHFHSENWKIFREGGCPHPPLSARLRHSTLAPFTQS